MSDQEVKSYILQIVAKYLDLSRFYVFLFGSRATGQNFPRSDWDIGVFGSEKIPGDKMAQLKGDLEDSNIVYMVDVVDFQGLTEDFKKIALSKIELWNTPKIKLALI